MLGLVLNTYLLICVLVLIVSLFGVVYGIRGVKVIGLIGFLAVAYEVSGRLLGESAQWCFAVIFAIYAIFFVSKKHRKA